MSKVAPRQDRIQWHDHHMLQALLAAQRSPDPNTQVGACIVDSKNRVIGLGYNGLPRGISVEQISWSRDNKDPLQTKYPYVVHAETNAITNCNASTKDAILYITMFSCNECAKDIIQAGIKEIHYLTNPYKDTWSAKAADKMFQLVDILTIKHIWDKEKTEKCLQNITTSMQLVV